jgi:hypothetical protein
MSAEIVRHAADLAMTHGPDIDEALRLWNASGGADGGGNAQVWLSVAFMFGRHHRFDAGASTADDGLSQALV